ncbi:MAG TPA: NAD(P)H-binding protein [Enterovirga sp.]|nr:NAD(P)H-binding protein [Enterovirga sp.]
MTSILLVGATGLVGRNVLAQALRDPRIGRVVAPTRRPLPARPGLENPVVDFDDLSENAPWWGVDAVICTLGTTIRAAGSQAAFRRVDHDYPLAVARHAREHGARSFALNSAMGADPNSRFFYSRVKGEVEESLARCGFASLILVRPGLIGGERDEIRPAEFLAQRVLGVLGPMLPRRYRVVPAENIASALTEAAIKAKPGRHIVPAEAMV